MTQAALQLSPTPALARLLERELTPENLAAALGGTPALPERLWERALAAPLRAIAARPGKEFRARLVALGWEMAGGHGEPPVELEGVVEALHLGSLIVDDIEDASSRRRGGPSLHQLVGLPLALNAGNWLYFLPGVLVSRLRVARRLELELRIAIDDAVRNCHYGQALDLSARVTELRQREVPNVVRTTTRLKTGSLTELAVRLGAIAAESETRNLAALACFGRSFGVGLQMLDDLTGLTSERRCHKGHEDLLDARPTWPWCWLAENADAVAYVRLRALAEEVARRDLHPEVLAEELRHAIAEPGRRAIREHLGAALSELCEAFGEERVPRRLREELARLEDYDG